MSFLIFQVEASLESYLLNKCFFNDKIKKQDLFVHKIMLGASGNFMTNSYLLGAFATIEKKIIIRY